MGFGGDGCGMSNCGCGMGCGYVWVGHEGVVLLWAWTLIRLTCSSAVEHSGLPLPK